MNHNQSETWKKQRETKQNGEREKEHQSKSVTRRELVWAYRGASDGSPREVPSCFLTL